MHVSSLLYLRFDTNLEDILANAFLVGYEWYPADTVVIDLGDISAGDVSFRPILVKTHKETLCPGTKD